MYRVENDNLSLNGHIVADFKNQKVFTKNNFRNRTAGSFLLVLEPENIYRLESIYDLLVPGDRSQISHSKNGDIFRIEKQFTGQIIYVKLFRNSPRGEAAYKVFCDFLNVKIKEN